MANRWGLGPVFAWEWAAGTRRWQIYAARALFVGALLGALISVRMSHGDLNFSTKAQARVGQAFFFAIVGTQLVLVMLAAPAATAGAICIDRARGTLAHLLVTDLSSGEIVLGKLAARLTPVLTLVACTLPVLLICTLLGGVDPSALTGAFAVIAGEAVLGCALAMTLSVWMPKAHEVLMATYLVLIAGPLAAPAWRGLVSGPPPDWMQVADPFTLAFGPYLRPGSIEVTDYLIFLFGALASSAALTALAVARLRAVGAREAGRSARRRRGESRVGFRPMGWLPGPSLDGNPVLWREWHRRRPSRSARVIWAAYLGGSVLFSGAAIWQCVSLGRGGWAHGFAAWVNGLQVTVGFLLLSVSAATALAEERQRGGLDVLLATPLPTRQIVWGKWWGAYRAAAFLAILPVAVATSIGPQRERWPGLALIVGFVLALGAAISSLGLALATWVPRLGRALALSVTAYVFVAVGWLFLSLALVGPGPQRGEGLMGATPFFGIGNLTFLMGEMAGEHWRNFAAWMVGWILAYATAAGLLMAATLATFDRCMGRISDVPGRPGLQAKEGKMLALEDLP